MISQIRRLQTGHLIWHIGFSFRSFYMEGKSLPVYRNIQWIFSIKFHVYPKYAHKKKFYIQKSNFISIQKTVSFHTHCFQYVSYFFSCGFQQTMTTFLQCGHFASILTSTVALVSISKIRLPHSGHFIFSISMHLIKLELSFTQF